MLLADPAALASDEKVDSAALKQAFSVVDVRVAMVRLRSSSLSKF